MSFFKTYESIVDSSIMDQGSDVFKVFISMCAIADENGIVDVTRSTLSARLRMTRTRVNSAIEKLESEDPESRSADQDGRRIVRLDDHRDWGWIITTYMAYRDMDHVAEKRARKAKYQAEYRARRAAQKAEESAKESAKTQDLRPKHKSEHKSTQVQHKSNTSQGDMCEDMCGEDQNHAGQGSTASHKSGEQIVDRTSMRSEILDPLRGKRGHKSATDLCALSGEGNPAPPGGGGAGQIASNPSLRSVDVFEIYLADRIHWSLLLGRNKPKALFLIKANVRVIEDAFATGRDAETLKRIIGNVQHSPWHMGENGSQSRLALRDILREDQMATLEQIDKETRKIPQKKKRGALGYNEP